MSATASEITIEMLKGIEARLVEQAVEIRALRETVIRLETHGYHEQIKNLHEQVHELRNAKHALDQKITVLETQGKFFTAGISAGVSIFVSVMAGLFLWAFKNVSA